MAQVSERVATELDKRTQKQKKEDEWVDKEIKKLEEEGLKFDRNELLKTALDYLPSDENGNISFQKAYNIMKATKPVSAPSKVVEEKKKVADMTLSKSNATEEQKDYKTSEDFRGKSISDLLRD